MGSVFRVLDQQPCAGLADYLAGGGGDALHIARSMPPVAVVDLLADGGRERRRR